MRVRGKGDARDAQLRSDADVDAADEQRLRRARGHDDGAARAVERRQNEAAASTHLEKSG